VRRGECWHLLNREQLYCIGTFTTTKLQYCKGPSLESWSDNKGRLLVYINHILLAGSISDKCFLIFIHIQHHANIESSILYIFLKNSMRKIILTYYIIRMEEENGLYLLIKMVSFCEEGGVLALIK
jgi:hypothetical protein